MLHGAHGVEPNLTREGLHFASIAVVTDVEAVTALDGYFSQAHNAQNISGYGFGEAVGYRVLEDLPGVSRLAGVIYVGLVRKKMHWITTDKGLPLHFTDAVYQIVQKFNFEENIPMHTPAMGVPRTARQTSSTAIARLIPLSQSFRIEGEAYARGFDNIQVVAGLAASANGIASHSAREAYGAIITGKSTSPLTAPLVNTEAELIFRAMEERSLHAIFHKKKDAFSILAGRAFTVMQSSPSRVTPTVAIFPFGKMQALLNSPSYTQYWLAGDVGPKRVKNGSSSDIDTGVIIDGDKSVLELSGVEVREAPMVTNFDTSVEEMSRMVYTGEFFNFSPPSNCHFGGDDVLPWAEMFSPEKDCRTKIHFIDLVRRCGWFTQVPGCVGGNGHSTYSASESNYLWRVNTARWANIANANLLPEAGADADPFVFRDGANIRVRAQWLETKRRFLLDVPVFWPYHVITDQEAAIAAAEVVPPAAGGGIPAFNAGAQGNWPYTKWDVERRRRDNTNRLAWNWNIATLQVRRQCVQQEADVADATALMYGATADGINGDGVYQILRNAGRIAEEANADLRRTAVFNALQVYAFSQERMDLVFPNFQLPAAGDNAAAAAGNAWLRDPARNEISALTTADLAKRLDFLLFRPMQQAMMQDVAFIRSGAELGKTFMSHPLISIGRDVSVNSWLWTIQYRSVAMVTNADYVTVFRNVLYDGMGTGNNTDVFTHDQLMALRQGNYGLSEGDPSVIAIPVPKRTEVQDLMPFDKSRTVVAVAGVINGMNPNREPEPHYPGFRSCQELYGWNRLVVSPTPQQSVYPIAPLMFRGDLVWPTATGELREECHSMHGRADVGVREVRMYGRGLNPTAI